MATADQRGRLRRDVGATADSRPDPECDAIYAEAAEEYPEGAAQDAQARVIALRAILASSAKLVTYRQNASSESASDVFKHLSQLVEYWQGVRDAAVADSQAQSNTAAALFTLAKARRQ